MKPCKPDRRGRVHSFESLGTHEGPGIRYVIFMQGCLGRCAYCQNPDTWPLDAGMLLTAKEVFRKIEKCLPYIRSSNGGVTVSGGEPLLQPEFIADLFRLCRKADIHTAIDTSGFLNGPLDKNRPLLSLVRATDLFLVDLKSAKADLHRKLTTRKLEEALAFINLLEAKKRPYWIRYVLVPGVNGSKSDMADFKTLISRFKYCQKVEFLPYHTLGTHKWKHLRLKYRLNKVRPATAMDIKGAEDTFKINSFPQEIK